MEGSDLYSLVSKVPNEITFVFGIDSLIRLLLIGDLWALQNIVEDHGFSEEGGFVWCFKNWQKNT